MQLRLQGEEDSIRELNDGLSGDLRGDLNADLSGDLRGDLNADLSGDLKVGHHRPVRLQHALPLHVFMETLRAGFVEKCINTESMGKLIGLD